MAFQPDGFYNSPAISSSITLRRCLYVPYNVHMVTLVITSSKLITLLVFSGQPPGVCFGGEASGWGCLVCRPSLRVLDGSLELSCFLSSLPLLWRWLHLWGQCNLCRGNHSGTSIQALMSPMLFVPRRGLMKLKWEPLGCAWSVAWFHITHGFSSTPLDTKSHTVCDLEIEIFSTSRQKCWEGFVSKKVPMLVLKSSVQVLGFLQDDLFSSCWIGGCLEPVLTSNPIASVRKRAHVLAGVGHTTSKPEVMNCCNRGLCQRVWTPRWYLR